MANDTGNVYVKTPYGTQMVAESDLANYQSAFGNQPVYQATPAIQQAFNATGILPANAPAYQPTAATGSTASAATAAPKTYAAQTVSGNAPSAQASAAVQSSGWAQQADGSWKYTGSNPAYQGNTGHFVGDTFYNDSTGNTWNPLTGAAGGPSLVPNSAIDMGSGFSFDTTTGNIIFNATSPNAGSSGSGLGSLLSQLGQLFGISANGVNLSQLLKGLGFSAITAQNILTSIQNGQLQAAETNILNNLDATTKQYLQSYPTLLNNAVANSQAFASAYPTQTQIPAAELALFNKYANLTPADISSMTNQLEQPLSQNLTNVLTNQIQAQLAERGLAQAPGIFANELAQSLAPYQIQEQQMAQDALFKELGLPTQVNIPNLQTPPAVETPTFPPTVVPEMMPLSAYPTFQFSPQTVNQTTQAAGGTGTTGTSGTGGTGGSQTPPVQSPTAPSYSLPAPGVSAPPFVTAPVSSPSQPGLNTTGPGGVTISQPSVPNLTAPIPEQPTGVSTGINYPPEGVPDTATPLNVPFADGSTMTVWEDTNGDIYDSSGSLLFNMNTAPAITVSNPQSTQIGTVGSLSGQLANFGQSVGSYAANTPIIQGPNGQYYVQLPSGNLGQLSVPAGALGGPNSPTTSPTPTTGGSTTVGAGGLPPTWVYDSSTGSFYDPSDPEWYYNPSTQTGTFIPGGTIDYGDVTDYGGGY